MEYTSLFLVCGLILPLGFILARKSLSHLLSKKYKARHRRPGFMVGHLRELLLSSDYGEHEFKWQSQYGSLYKIKGVCGEDRLMVSDPGALKQIMGDPETFVRSDHHQQIVLSLIGHKSLLYMRGRDHSRVRGIMNPAFSTANIRALPPLFRNVAERMIEKLEKKRTTLDWTSRSTCVVPSMRRPWTRSGKRQWDICSTQRRTARNMHAAIIILVALSSTRSQAGILVEAMLPLLPHFIHRALLYLPRPELRAMRKNRTMAALVSTRLDEIEDGCIASGLCVGAVKANTSKDGVPKMTSLELSQQIPTAVVAGQGGTATTLVWALYELAKDLDFQHKLRLEISESGPPDGELSYADLEGMPLLNAFLKVNVVFLVPDLFHSTFSQEVLRFHSGPPGLRACPSRSLAPLGEQLSSVAVKKGQFIFSALWSYNRLPTIWGPDAHEFKPSRWLEGTPYQGQAMGPYSNLRGPRMCIGITEVQVILTELVKRYSFELSANIEIHCNVAVTLIPVTVDGGDPELPLIVRPVESYSL
ncbi:cytochrome P450 [Mycena rebaudengoi]|nr:cytochrome P450 [Mycena rebaudengoi]